jgi:hypothetical protein
MTAGPLHPDNLTSGNDRSLGKGHGVGALGPSDSSDSGSDMQGAPGLEGNLEDDSDSTGTGERAAAVRDTVVPDGADIDTDHVETLPDLDDEDEDTKH